MRLLIYHVKHCVNSRSRAQHSFMFRDGPGAEENLRTLRHFAGPKGRTWKIRKHNNGLFNCARRAGALPASPPNWSSKGTLINWSRKFQFQIGNERAIEMEALQEQLIPRAKSGPALAEQLKRVEAELATRDLTQVPRDGSTAWPARCGSNSG